MISLRNISKIYSRKQSNEDVVALDNINLTLPEVGFISILGASGSGKTTLLNIIGGLDEPTSGEMVVDEISTKNFKGKDWDAYRNEKIGFVLQNCYLLPHLSIKDNIAIKLQISNHEYKNISEMVDKALEEVDLLDRRNDKPKQLSGGQKQRVAIARAIVGEPVVILADEPTGALDSKTGGQIMTLLKKLSKNHLVIMVTHNREYANTYSDRIIELKDGKIISDNNQLDKEVVVSDKKMGKVAFPFFTSLKWGLKNLVVKKYSTLSIVLASSLGLAGVGLILSISNGVEQAFIKSEEEALAKYPVYITSYSKQSSEGSKEQYTEFTDEEFVYVDMSGYASQEHFNYMSDEFLTYMGEMPKDYYYISYDTSVTSFKMYTQVNESSYRRISSTYFYKGVSDQQFISREYDCLKGKYPVAANEVALVLDTYNRVSGRYLYSLGFDIDISKFSEIKLTFDDVIGKTYKYITNDEYYNYDSGTDRFVSNGKSIKQLYEDSTYEIKIVGILRENEYSTNALYNTHHGACMIYTPEFEKKVIKDANESQIVIAQKQFGVDKDVTTGQPFFDDETGTVKYSASYKLEETLYNYGSYERVTSVYYYTDNFNTRRSIEDYFRAYVPDETIDFGTFTFNDYLEKVTIQFGGAMTMMTSVLYVFAGISVFVSAILNAILTYISIHQRTSEIGLLRSLGARKKDIGIMIETESLLCGFLGGILSILLSVIFINPINGFIKAAIYQYKFYLLSQTTFELSGFQWWVAPILIGIALLTALVSALIPAIIASRKDPARALNE